MEPMKNGLSPTRITKGISKLVKNKARKLLTGDEELRIRDVIKKREREPAFQQLFNKLTYTLGVLNIAVSQYFFLSRPKLFWLWYSLVIPCLMVIRIREFKKKKLEYFLIDFCYFTMFLTFLYLHLMYENQILFNVCYIYTNGPLAWAIIVWRCSLVFHDIEKVTSVYIHILPTMLLHCERWLHNTHMRSKYLTSSDYLYAIVLYLMWQALYFVKTEILDTYKLDTDPSYITSLRWLSKDTKNIVTKLTRDVMRKVGILGPNESFDSNSYKTKFIFMGTQLFYTILTFLPAYVLFMSEIANLTFIILLFTFSTFYGAGYYVYMGIMTRRSSEQNLELENIRGSSGTNDENEYENKEE